MNKTLSIVAIFAATFLCAQQEQMIDTVQISGRTKVKKERAEFKRHGQSTETLSEYELSRNNSAFVEQTLNTMAGVQVDKRTNLGGQRVVVRGYGNDQKFNNWGTKFYLNSVPLTNADGVTLLEDIDFSLINNIEVVKGPAATMYGGGVGGAVRFYMRPEITKGVSLSEKIAAGSFGLLQSNTRVDAVGDHYSVMLNYGHLESDGYRPRGSSLKNNYAFLGTFKLNPKQSLTVYASHNFSNEGVSGQISYADYYAGIDNGNYAYAKKNAGNKFISDRVTVSHHWNILPNFSNMTSVYYSNLDANRIAAGAYEQSMNPNYGFRSTFSLKNKIGEDFQNSVEAGVEYTDSRSLVTNYRFTGTNDAVPNQVQDLAKGGSYFKNINRAYTVFAIERLTYVPYDMSLLVGVSGNSLQYERLDLLALPGLVPNYNKDLSFQKNFSTVFTPHFALQKTWHNQIFNLSYSEGYNAPSAATAFIAGTGKANDDLKPERAQMWDFSIHGLLEHTHLDYQVSVFRIDVNDKLTQLSGGNYNYWANTGSQKNQGLELSLGYLYHPKNSFLSSIRPVVDLSYYDFKYKDFKTMTGGVLQDYSHMSVVGVPRTKFTVGLDFDTHFGIYLLNTFSYLDKVYTDFNNFNPQNPNPYVDGFTQYNAKLGYKHSFGKFDLDAYIAGNNLTSQINYTFLFLGNNVKDSDPGSQYYGVATTDVNPGPSKAYFFGGLNLKYRF
ncbi:TonB-dependent receptor [Chryseobacterium koreense]|uniref:TonB-dependent receptor n=1 Tax=Chryseobacterium koreense TaxID=232216 RepID=UPI0026F36EDC|nr:TonB-dependent receptor plug domain-containing protein [Chryseobacterium koreense]